MKDDHFRFTAHDGAQIFVYRWRPDNGIGRAVLHIAHGLAEHAGRYQRLAEVLATNGYFVFAHDHRGHGRTARTAEDIGYFGDEDSWNRVVTDLAEMCQTEREEYPQLPLILFGHSAGSMMAQQAVYEFPDLFDAVVMSGASGIVSGLVQIGRAIARIERWRLGKRGRSALINSLSFGSFNKPFTPNRTAFDWLTRDEDEVDKYIADPMCGFIASAQLWVDMLDAIPKIAKAANRARIPKNLPIYLFSGSQDQVNENGRGCEMLARAYQEAGLGNVSYRIYPDARHETLNEINRKQVAADLVDWLECVRVLDRHGDIDGQLLPRI